LSNILTVLLNAVYSFIALFIVAKLLGKKQIAELDFIDYVVGISIGSIASEWSTEIDDPWYHYAIAIGVYFIISMSISYIERTNTFLKAIFRGKPIVVIDAGKIVYKNLQKSKLDINDLLGMCRNKNYFDINDIAFAIFETSGELSILPKANQTPVVIDDLNKTAPPPKLTKFLIIDGKIDNNYLKILKKNKTWLFKKLKIKSKKELKNIIIATYNEQTEEIKVHYKIE